MTIPEPTADELSYNLCHFYDDNQNTVFPDRFKNVLIAKRYQRAKRKPTKTTATTDLFSEVI